MNNERGNETKNYLVMLEIQDKYSMLRHCLNYLIPAKSLSEAKEKAKKYWNGADQENVRERIIPVIDGEEMQLDDFVDMSIPKDPDLDLSWIQKYHLCVKYFEENGNLLIPTRYEVDGVKLGQWIHANRCNKKSGLLSSTKIQMLEQIGMVWEARAGRRKDKAKAKADCEKKMAAEAAEKNKNERLATVSADSGTDKK